MTDVCPYSYNLLPIKRMLFIKHLQEKKKLWLVSSTSDEQEKVFQASMKITGALQKEVYHCLYSSIWN